MSRKFIFFLLLLFIVACYNKRSEIVGEWKLVRIAPYNVEDLDRIQTLFYDYYKKKLDSARSKLDYYDSLYADTVKPAEVALLSNYYVNLKNYMLNFENSILFKKYIFKKMAVLRNQMPTFSFYANGDYVLSQGGRGQWKLRRGYLDLYNDTLSYHLKVLRLNDSILRIKMPFKLEHINKDFNFVYEFRKIEHPNNKN